jgi:TolB-like protein/DNA-binding winged helix-turn-helix (wHTH) protein
MACYTPAETGITFMAGTSSLHENRHFGVFEVDVQARELRKKGSRVKLQQQPFELLMILLEHPGQVVSREDLRQRLWPADVYVDFDRGLNKAMVKLREALGDSPESPIYVETLPKVGYRFIGPVNSSQLAPQIAPVAGGSAVDLLSKPEFAGNGNERTIAPPASAEVVPAPKEKIRWRLGLAILAAVLIVLGFGTAWARWHRAAISAPIRSIAVLPLDNLSGDPGQDYLAAGMTDELTTMLAKHSNLRVISRTSATSVMQPKGAHRPLPEIARELGVDGILEGSVERTGDKVHMTIQLIQAPSDSHVWAESYDRNANDLVTLPSDAANTIAKKLNAAVAQPVSTRYVNPEAHDAYLRGLYLWYAGNNDSIKYFKKATELQPDYALGWCGISFFYGAAAIDLFSDPRDALPQQKAAAEKALALDDSLPEAHLAMAASYFNNEWDFDRALHETRRAIELDPKFAEAYHFRSKILSSLGRHAEAIEVQKKASELDPFARPYGLALTYAYARQYDAATAEVMRRRESNPNDSWSHWMLDFIYQCQGKWKESAEERAKSFSSTGDNKSAETVRTLFANGGVKAVAAWDLNHLKTQGVNGYVSPVKRAWCYVQLGQREHALDQLEDAYRQHSPGLLEVQQVAIFDVLHGEPRYRAIIQAVGLPPAY